MLINWLKADIKSIVRDFKLLTASLYPVALVLFLKLAFIPLSGFVFLKTGFNPENYFSIIAITLVTLIPVLFGIISAIIMPQEYDTYRNKEFSAIPSGGQVRIFMRVMPSAGICFLLLLLTLFLADPVPTQGWLRTIFVSLLLAAQTPLVFLFISGIDENKIKGWTLSVLYGVFTAAVPFGLMVHHPLNYFVFISPLYWISWAWVSISASESLIYGFISLLLTSLTILWLFNRIIKNRRI